MKVAFLGLGIMGSRMAANLSEKGFELTVWNRTAEVAAEFAAKRPQVKVARTPSEAGEGAELVLTMVVDGPQVTELLLGAEGAASAASPQTLFADCSTIGPAYAQSLAAGLAERGFDFLDSPVTGSSPRAKDGTLVFMVGGKRERFDWARPAFEAMGTTIVYAGASGQGQAVKVINNAVAAVNAATLAQALLSAARQGVDMDALVQVLAGGSGGSAMVDLKARPMLEHDYTPLFKLDHMLKDVRLCLDAAAQAGASFEFADETAEILAEASASGYGDQDFAALIEVVQARAGQPL